MQDRFNTAAGWVLFSGIVALGLSSVSAKYFQADKPHRPHTMGFPIEGVVEEGAAAEGPPLATLLAEGDAAKGEAIFAKCIACHTIEQGGANGIGPNLHDAFGRAVASHGGYEYSDAMQAHGGAWDYLALNDFLTSPASNVRGTKMAFAGLRNEQDRVAMIAYLRSISPNNVALPAPLPEAAPAEAEGDAAATTTTEAAATPAPAH